MFPNIGDAILNELSTFTHYEDYDYVILLELCS